MRFEGAAAPEALRWRLGRAPHKHSAGCESRGLRDLQQLSLEVLSYLSLEDILAVAETRANETYALLSSVLSRIAAAVPFKPALRWCFSIVYKLYIEYPMELIDFARARLSALVRLVCRRSSVAPLLVMHIVCLYELAVKLLHEIVHSSPADLVAWLVQTATYIWHNKETVVEADEDIPWLDMVDLLAYEEVEEDLLPSKAQGRTRRMMHHYVPTNKFRATVRSRRYGGTPDQDAVLSQDDPESSDVCTPVSLPPTPYSRAKAMLRSAERAESIMYGARDRLQLELLANDKDQLTRARAAELKNRGRLAVFDGDQSAEGLALLCGNHCVIKYGRAMCCSTRTAVPITRDCFVYMEFAVTAQSGVAPSIVIGLSPPDCPLNVMVGSWPRSIGLYSEGQLLVGSKWYQAPKKFSFTAGATVGMLVYLREQAPPDTLSGILSKATAAMHVKTSRLTGRHVHFEDEEVLRGAVDLCAEQDDNSGFEEILALLGLQQGLSWLCRGNTSSPSKRKTPPPSPVSFSTATGSFDQKSEPELPQPASPVVEQQQQPQQQQQLSPGETKSPQLAVENEAAPGAGPDAGAGLHSESPVSSLAPLHQPEDMTHDEMSPKSTISQSSARMMNLFSRFCVNGEPIFFTPEAARAANDIADGVTPLHPTVSIISNDTKVWGRFCVDDVVYKTRREIGAPAGVPVYCLDGSLLLAADDE